MTKEKNDSWRYCIFIYSHIYIYSPIEDWDFPSPSYLYWLSWLGGMYPPMVPCWQHHLLLQALRIVPQAMLLRPRHSPPRVRLGEPSSCAIPPKQKGFCNKKLMEICCGLLKFAVIWASFINFCMPWGIEIEGIRLFGYESTQKVRT